MDVLREDRGNSLISTMVGAIISVLLLGLIAGGLMVFVNFFITIGSSNVITSAKTTVEQRFRQDITWASNIPSDTATANKVLFTIPNRSEETCSEVEWTLAPVESKLQLQRNTRVYSKIIKPQTNTPSTAGSSTGTSICGGELKHEQSEVLLKDAGAESKFSYANARAVTLTKNAKEMQAPKSTEESIFERSALQSARIAGVTLTTGAASSGTKSSHLVVTHYAKNLEFKLLPIASFQMQEMILR